MADGLEPHVSLVGAGPGPEGLLTLRGRECLGRADWLFHETAVHRPLLDLAPPAAVRVALETPDRSRILEAARCRQRVVVLYVGDPFLSGRGGADAELLSRSGIPFEVVPGVSLAQAAIVHAGMAPDGTDGRGLWMRAPAGGTSLGDASAVRLTSSAQSLVLTLPAARLGQTAALLLASRRSKSTPVLVIRRPGVGDQQIESAVLGELAFESAGERSAGDIVLIVGPAAARRPRPGWAETRPLSGKRIVVTRPLAQAAAMARTLEVLGAVPLLMPLVEVGPPARWLEADRALAELNQYDWLVFTSTNGVHALVHRLAHVGADLRALGGRQLAAIGPGTASALQSHLLRPDYVPLEYRSEDLAEGLRERVAGRRVLLARADRGRELLADQLRQVANVHQVAVYAQSDVCRPDPAVLECLEQGLVDYVTVTSSNIARVLARLLGERGRQQIMSGRVRLVSISPVTSAVLRDLGLNPAQEARQYTIPGVVDALVRLNRGE